MCVYVCMFVRLVFFSISLAILWASVTELVCWISSDCMRKCARKSHVRCIQIILMWYLNTILLNDGINSVIFDPTTGTRLYFETITDFSIRFEFLVLF